MTFKTIFTLALTIFCGAGAGLFLKANEQSLFGTYLYTFFPFAVALLFLAIGHEVLSKAKVKAKDSALSAEASKPREAYSGHHPKAA
jgi:hypothetical protein